MRFTWLLFRVESVLLVVSLIAVFIVAIVAINFKFPTTFDVNAQTERLDFITMEKPKSRWTLENAEVTQLPSDSATPFTGEFEPAGSIKVKVERIALGPLRITVESVGQESSAGIFLVDGEPIGRAGWMVDIVISDLPVRANAGQSVVIPVTGEITLGRELGVETPGTTAILRSGKITMLEWSLFGNNVFEADSVDLDAGDVFRIDDAASPSLGFIVADERPAFTAAYRVAGTNASIIRPSGGTYPLSVSFLKRILNDHLFQGISVLFGALVVIVTLLTFLLDWRNFRREPMKSAAIEDDSARSGEIEQRKTKEVASASFLLCLLIPATTLAQEVYVEAGQHGQGVLRARKSECFVITPYHVVKSAGGSFKIIGSKTLSATGTLVEGDETADLAIVRIEGPLECAVWESHGNVQLEKQRDGHLSIREDDGSLSLIPVNLRNIDSEFIKIKLSDPTDRIQKTMSGASLIVNEKMVGLLLKLCPKEEGCNDELQKGEGIVFRLDAMMKKLEPFFGVSPMLDVAIAQSILDRVIQAKDGSMQGQVEAMESLLARSHQFSDADLSGISFRGANLTGGVFKGAKLHASDLTDVKAKDADFANSGLRFTRLELAKLQKKANLSESYAPFVWGKEANFEGANLSRANFFGADFQGVDFRNADLRGTAFAFANLRGAKFDGADLTGAYFTGAVLDGATFLNTTIKNTDFAGAAANKISLTPKQKSGACRHNMSRLDERLGLEFGIQLIEEWPSNKYSTGYEFDHISDTRWYFKNFADKSLPLCSTPPDVAQGYNAQYAGNLRVHLDRAYISKAGRRSAFRKRVEDHLEFLKLNLSKDRNLEGDKLKGTNSTQVFNKQDSAAPPKPIAETASAQPPPPKPPIFADKKAYMKEVERVKQENENHSRTLAESHMAKAMRESIKTQCQVRGYRANRDETTAEYKQAYDACMAENAEALRKLKETECRSHGLSANPDAATAEYKKAYDACMAEK